MSPDIFLLPLQGGCLLIIRPMLLVCLGETSKPPHKCKMLVETLTQRRFPLPGLRQLGRRHGFVGALDCPQQFLLVVGEDSRLLLAAAYRHVELPPIRCRERLARLADDYPMDRL